MSRPAVFLDRDGTLIHDSGYLHRPADLLLLPGVVEALRALEAAGFLRIVITNQSGIGRGLYGEAEYRAVEAALEEQLNEHGASIDASYHCPHLPEAGCTCRKPGTRLHRQAAGRFDIDLSRSWCVGDRMSDLLAAEALGTRAALVLTGEGTAHRAAAAAAGYPIGPDLLGVVNQSILRDDPSTG